MLNFWKSILKALIAAIIAATVLVFIFALLAGKNEDPSKLVAPFGEVAFYLSCIVGGALAGRGGGLVADLVFGAIYILLCFFASLVAGGEINAVGTALTYTGGMVAVCLGGMVFSGSGKRRSRAFKKYKKKKH